MSGYLIVATDAWMQYPVAYQSGPARRNHACRVSGGCCLNPWALWQYAHNMSGAVITGAFVMAAIGAFYLLTKQFQTHAKTFVRVGVIAGLVAALLQLMPTGDAQGRMLANHQPATLGRDGRPVCRLRRARRSP